MMRLFLLAIMMIAGERVSGQCTYTSTGSTSWTTASTWTTSGTGCNGTYPGQNETDDIVIISSDHVVTLNIGGSVTVATVTLTDGGAADTRLIVDNTDLTVTGLFSIGSQTQITIQNNSAVVIKGDLLYDGNNGNIDVGGGTGNTLLIEGCLRKATGQPNTNIIGGDLIWCINPDQNCPNAGQGESTGGCGLLPVTLTSLQVISSNGQSILYWQTSTELNNDYFEIQRSMDGIRFDAIGNVDGFGTTDLPQSYSYTDYEPFSHTIYYRLKQVDFDGTFAYSPVVVARGTDTSAATDRIWMQQKNLRIEMAVLQNAQIVIYNVWGQLVESEELIGEIINPSVTIDMETLPQGMYVVHIVQQGQKVFSKKVMLR